MNLNLALKEKQAEYRIYDNILLLHDNARPYTVDEFLPPCGGKNSK